MKYHGPRGINQLALVTGSHGNKEKKRLGRFFSFLDGILSFRVVYFSVAILTNGKMPRVATEITQHV